MNISLDTLVIASSCIVSVCGFVITAGIMLKSNKLGFAAIDAKITGVSVKIDIEKENAIFFLKEVRNRYSKELMSMEATMTNFHGQIKSEIYPRLNAVEGDVKKNCQALRDHKELCEEKHRKVG